LTSVNFTTTTMMCCRLSGRRRKIPLKIWKSARACCGYGVEWRLISAFDELNSTGIFKTTLKLNSYVICLS